MNGSQIRNSLNMLNMQMNGLRGAGQMGRFGTGTFNALAAELQNPKKKKKNSQKKKNKKKNADMDAVSQKGKGAKAQGTERVPDPAPEGGKAAASSGPETGNSLRVTKSCDFPVKRNMDLQEAFAWTEILGEPLARKRRRRRVNQSYGSQSNADRR